MPWRPLAIVLLSLGAPWLPAWGGTADDWYVGEQVVCVNNRFLDLSDAPELSEGSLYTIKEILPRRRGHVGLAVLETAAKDKFLAFDERRFLPLKIVAAVPPAQNPPQTAAARTGAGGPSGSARRT